MSEVNVLQVLLYGKLIGTLNLLPGDQTIFAFTSDYINDLERPTLSLSFKNNRGELITDIRPTRMRLPTFFSNLLPEGPLRDYLANHAGVKSKREFFLLSALGRDLPGAITVEPTNDKSWLPESSDNDRKISHKNTLRFSLAGVQLKLSAILNATGGLTIPAEGIGGSWIVKLPSMRFADVPENEYSMMTLARMIGMDIPDIKLIPTEKIIGLPDDLSVLQDPALAVRRFDRTDSGPVHIEDFAQIFAIYPDDKYKRASYKNIAEVLWAETGEKGIEEFIRRLVFNTLIGNADMHLKNWSLTYPDQRNAMLAPGYDFVSTIPYIKDDSMALNYVKTKRMADLSSELLIYFAAKAGLPEKLVLTTAQQTVIRFQEIWKSEQKHLPLAKSVIAAIEANIKTIKF